MYIFRLIRENRRNNVIVRYTYDIDHVTCTCLTLSFLAYKQNEHGGGGNLGRDEQCTSQYNQYHIQLNLSNRKSKHRERVLYLKQAKYRHENESLVACSWNHFRNMSNQSNNMCTWIECLHFDLLPVKQRLYTHYAISNKRIRPSVIRFNYMHNLAQTCSN